MRIGRALGITAAVGAAAAGAAWLWRHQGDIAFSRPVNEWTFTHMDRVMPTETVHRPLAARALPTSSTPLGVSGVRYEFEGRLRSIAELHDRTHTTAFLVAHRGEVVHESYPGRFAGPTAKFQLFSLTKSVTSMLVGIALERGEIRAVTNPVVDYVPSLKGSGYDGVTLEHLLNMSSGVGGVEDWTVPDAPIKQFEEAVTTGGSVLDVIRALPRLREPGTAFNYSTVDTHVIGWLLEAATGKTLAQYATEHLWEPMGAESDAFYFLTRGKPRTALGGGSLNATVRDLARVGSIMAAGGRVGETQLVPEAWVARSRGSDLPQFQVGALMDGGGTAHYGYSNQWWTLGGERRAYTGLGVHGQFLWIDPDSETVIVKTSAWNDPDDDARDAETCAALAAVVRAVVASE
ncbi:CubicO group peptidase (beta-lactamase class C family) [Leucobacter komagatae]|uniref:CubicO group peptidase (Beta-lactamase class C family) n=1 Tax=Leucobacter komagatae TaxID=55969 RepID=A0A542Y5Y9_9MICO|nr:serine hydrolase [Leucobacter komagatae]TQL43512.1 CubicO group peptidase (beta-lactamase class C family) [Leucobacter komagatae]